MSPAARSPACRLALLVVVGLACGETTAGGGPSSVPLSVCTPAQSVSGAPVSDPSGPYYHQTVIARTTDGLTLSGAHQVLDHASVPDGVRRADGTVLVYYVNGQDGGVWVARIAGDSALPVSAIIVNGVSAPLGVVDPDATLLPTGTIRLAYFAGFGPPTTSTTRAMCIADSDDGIHFTAKSVALSFTSSEMLTDPSLLALPDGEWLMAISSGQRTLIARSGDGLAFTRERTFDIGGVPELAGAPDGAPRLYVCAQGIVSYRSTDGGRTWTREATVIGPGFNGKPIVCDPSLVAGAGLFVFKTG